MKNIFIVCLSLLLTNVLFVSCSKDNSPAVIPPMGDMFSFKGTFVSSAHPTSGSATVNKEKTKLNLTDFKSDAGPDLDIYLASDLSNITADFINLGDIKGLDGNYMYDLPASTDLAKYKYIVVWCVDFNVNFGYSALAP